MGIRRGAFLLAASILLGAGPLGLRAQGASLPPNGQGEDSAENIVDYYHTIGEDGKPIFTQVLRWEADENALEFELVIRRVAAGAEPAEVVRERTAEPKAEVHLGPGKYEYAITTFNLLGQAEAATDWVPLTVAKAQNPTIFSVEPSAMFIEEEPDGRISVRGDSLLEGCKVMMRSGWISFMGTEVEREGDEGLVVVFPERAYEVGDYDIEVKNPGGLTAVRKNAIRIRSQKLANFFLSLGYDPAIPLYDDWTRKAWPDAFHPLGFDANLDTIFVKQPWGHLGLGLRFQYRRMVGGINEAALLSDYLLYGASFVYKYRFTRSFSGLARLGGGITWSSHAIYYSGELGPTLNSLDPYFIAGLSVQYMMPIKLFFEAGIDYSNTFLKNANMGLISPSIRVGYQLY